jgi:hypothetical protein
MLVESSRICCKGATIIMTNKYWVQFVRIEIENNKLIARSQRVAQSAGDHAL